MREILTDIFHWRTEHPDIHVVVDSYYVAGLEPACLIDPLEPAEGLSWFEGREPPRHIYLTNRLHERHCRTFVDAQWITRKPRERAISLTPRGHRALEVRLGVVNL